VHDAGDVRPSFNPQPVRYSTQFGPPAEVPVYVMLVLDDFENGSRWARPQIARFRSGGTDLVLDDLVC
jgi:hypothetical protein